MDHPRLEIRGRPFVAVGTTYMPFRGEEERGQDTVGGRVLLFVVQHCNEKNAQCRTRLQLVSILTLPDPVTVSPSLFLSLFSVFLSLSHSSLA